MTTTNKVRLTFRPGVTQ